MTVAVEGAGHSSGGRLKNLEDPSAGCLKDPSGIHAQKGRSAIPVSTKKEQKSSIFALFFNVMLTKSILIEINT